MKKFSVPLTHSESKGSLNQLAELLAGKDGHYWLHELNLLMRKDPTHVLTDKWINDLTMFSTWDRAKDHYKKTKELWFNQPEWPFQICALSIGGISKQKFIEKWNKHPWAEDHLTKFINDFSWKNLESKKEILLIRLQERFLNLPKDCKFSQINCPHPALNLSLCPPESPFFLRLLCKRYLDTDRTLVATDFKPPVMADENKQRIFNFGQLKDYDNYLNMHVWDVYRGAERAENCWWIFQYDLK